MRIGNRQHVCFDEICDKKNARTPGHLAQDCVRSTLAAVFPRAARDKLRCAYHKQAQEGTEENRKS
jgi:hypothetical protein